MQKEFLEKNSKLVKQLGMLAKHEDTQKFYLEHPELVCEETANQLVVWCIDLAVEEVCICKYDAMNVFGSCVLVFLLVLVMWRV